MRRKRRKPKKIQKPQFHYWINEKIRADKVRVIDEEDGHLGIMPLAEALNLAKQKELDLVNINPSSDPPTVKIIDFGRFKYQKEKELKKCTDMAKAFKLDKEKDELEDEADKALKECLANNPLGALPYKQKADYPFTIQEVSVNVKNSSSISRLQLIMKVKIDEDIKNKLLFAYIDAVDKEGNSLIKKPGVFSSGFRNQDFTKGQQVELTGSIDGVKDLGGFEKFIFITREKYNK